MSCSREQYLKLLAQLLISSVSLAGFSWSAASSFIACFAVLQVNLSLAVSRQASASSTSRDTWQNARGMVLAPSLYTCPSLLRSLSVPLFSGPNHAKAA